MAAPGEFFPQQFASGILQLAQAQKQFQARLHEQRQQAAARNFIDKQQLELQERAQSLAEFRAGAPRPGGGGQSPVAGFRQRSAESAMGVRDQLAITKGTADIQRAAKLQDRTDAAVVQKAFADFEEKGVANIPASDVDLIDGLRQAFRAKFGAPAEGELKEVVRTDPQGNLVSTGTFSRRGPSVAGRKAPLPQVREIKMPDGSITVVGIGGDSLEQRKQLKELDKLDLQNAEITANIALTKERQESTRLQKVQRAFDAQEASNALGQLSGEQLAGVFALQKQIDDNKKTIIGELEAAYKSARSAWMTSETAATKKAKNEALQKLQDARGKTSIELAAEANPHLAPALRQFPIHVAASAMAAAKTQSGEQGPADQDAFSKLDPSLRSLIDLTPVDFAAERANDPNFKDRRHLLLNSNFTMHLRNLKTGKQTDAEFHFDRDGFIPLNAEATAIAKDLAGLSAADQRRRLQTRGARLSGTESFKFKPHPLASLLGFITETPVRQTKIGGPTAQPIPPASPEAEVRNDANTQARALLKAKAEATSPEDIQAINAQLRKLLETP